MTGAAPAVCWLALRLRSRFEFAVRDGLRAASIEEFLPTHAVESRWTDRTVVTTRPLFPGYIFARFGREYAAQLLAIRGVVQVLSLPSIDGTQKPVPISDEVIANLRRFVDSPAPLSLAAYVCGETVRVKSGPFAGVAGVIRRVKGATTSTTTLSIPVEILGRAVSVEIDAADVEAA